MTDRVGSHGRPGRQDWRNQTKTNEPVQSPFRSHRCHCTSLRKKDTGGTNGGTFTVTIGFCQTGFA